MSGNTVRIYKWFWADQDLEQEQWLREKAAQGLHLKRPAYACGWTFTRGAAADVAYRIDYRGMRDAAYTRLFEDAGWEHAGESAGWHYWRKKAVNGVAEEIFTDNASKIGKYRRVLAMLAVAIMPLTVILAVSDASRFMVSVSKPTMVLMAAIIPLLYVMYTYAALRLFRRIRSLREAGA